MTERADAVAANRANWDERVPIHLLAYGVEEFVRDATSITPVARDDLQLLTPHLGGGSVTGLDLVHLQCHIGLDTLSMARRGARVTGIDFSGAALNAARDIAARADLAARFIESDVDSARDACLERFDIVYTSTGVMCWLPDLWQWGEVVAGLLRPGGVFFLRDQHPILNSLDLDRTDGQLVLTRPYFDIGRPLRYDDGTTYADSAARLHHATTYEWQHSLSEIVSAVLAAGLELKALGEHETLPWPALPQLVPRDGNFVFPTEDVRVPLTFSLVATKPDESR